MRLIIPNISLPLADALRRCGYGFERQHDSGELSASRKMTAGEFPRFHIYAKFLEGPSTRSGQIVHSGKVLQITIHIDQKAPSYGGSRAHSGEYDGKLLDEEIKRVQDILMRA